MTQKAFFKQLDELIKSHKRRLEKLIAVQQGHGTIKSVPVKGHYVKRHWVSKHERIVATLSKSTRVPHLRIVK